MQFPITIGLHRSRFLVGTLCAIHGLAVLTLLCTPWREEIRVGLILLTLCAGLWALRSASIPYAELRLQAGGAVTGFRADKMEVALKVLPGSYVHPLLTAFRVQSDTGAIQALVILPDGISTEDFRRLRVWLRWKVSQADAADA